MFTQEANVEAVYRASELMFGKDASMILAKLADVIDQAMKDGYEQGLMDGLENVEASMDDAFDNGFEKGADVSGNTDKWDDGYLAGVDDARSRPGVADSLVQDILNDRADEAFEAIEDVLER
jgi:hypothetical protein